MYCVGSRVLINGRQRAITHPTLKSLYVARKAVDYPVGKALIEGRGMENGIVKRPVDAGGTMVLLLPLMVVVRPWVPKTVVD